jgi:hypothetical protein
MCYPNSGLTAPIVCQGLSLTSDVLDASNGFQRLRLDEYFERAASMSIAANGVWDAYDM